MKKLLRYTIAPILLATIWINVSEFTRNEFLVKSDWLTHFAELGIAFPEAPINGAMWGVWALMFAVLIFLAARRMSFTETVVLMWLAAFPLMWIVIGNLGVLPFSLLVVAIPLSILEVGVATLIIQKLSAVRESNREKSESAVARSASIVAMWTSDTPFR